MKLSKSDVASKCPDFSLCKSQDRYKCLHFESQYLPICNLPHRYICPLKKPELATFPYSHTQIQSFLQCRRLWFYQYVLSLEPVERPQYFVYGEIGHKALEKIHKGIYEETLDIKELSKQLDYDSLIKLNALLFNYWQRHKDEQGQTEIRIEFQPDRCPPFVAKIDFEGKETMMEHKFLKSLDIGISYRPQIIMYLLASWKDSIILNLLRKPALERRKIKGELESDNEFYERVLKDIDSRPESYFKRQKYYRSEFDLKAFVEFLKCVTGEMKIIRNALEPVLYYMNLRNCAILDCSFMSLCMTGQIDWTTYKHKEFKDADEWD